MAREKKFTKEELNVVKALMPRILAAAEAPLAEIEFDPADFNVDLDELPPADYLSAPGPVTAAVPLRPVSGTRAILIRVPERVIRAFKIEAERTGGHYQTLMNRALKVEAEGFV